MMDSAAIQRVIPHRPPFLFVDRVLECDPGRRALGIKAVSAGEPYLAGHFPGRPIVPGVILIEALAQVGAVALLTEPRWQGRIPLFGGVDGVRFRRQVVPGDVVRLEVEIVRMIRGLGKGRGTARVDGELAVEGELTFALLQDGAEGGRGPSADAPHDHEEDCA
jgi:3-hydroxyacyl-[acyl-carrier-protein] dehydratase